MSFIKGLESAIESSKSVHLIAWIASHTRLYVDKNGDGKVDVAEAVQAIEQAIPDSLESQFGIGLILDIVPLVAEIFTKIFAYRKEKKSKQA
jgi:hypothetical protein